MMPLKCVDVAIIGAGSAGLSAYQAAARFTDQIALIDACFSHKSNASHAYIPTKLLVAASEVATCITHHDRFGLQLDSQVHTQEVLSHIRQQNALVKTSWQQNLAEIPDTHKIQGQAHFADPHTLILTQANGHSQAIYAQRIVIATGAHLLWPASLAHLSQQQASKILDTHTLFDLPHLPKSLAIIGADTQALEIAQALQVLGVKVEVFTEKQQFGLLTDPWIRAQAQAYLQTKLTLHTQTKIHHVGYDAQENQVTIHYQTPNALQSTQVDYVLNLFAYQANLQHLALENAHIRLDDQGFPRFNQYTLQCISQDNSASHIFIIGDANQDRLHLHEALDEGCIAGENAGRYPKVQAGQRRCPLAIGFTQPSMAKIGLGYADLLERYRDEHKFALGQAQCTHLDARVHMMHLQVGWIRLYAEQGSGLFLGAELCTPRAEHLAHLLAWACQQRMSAQQMLAMPFYHPVLEETLRCALIDLNAQLKLGPVPDYTCMHL
ncbi:dihydrolipoamide dehydrogenase [Allopseudospirillum japonicum]|uniref:Dihydrolipoamide dehydrogenase n=1 Tax=Allopseudospirillum japonicum TaxID=64971 RepID=A0A1H6RMQ9_9GAMM|nr:dihydrolipoyl dehydrogenase [Allopseudospirillum japonicum]SEI52492.1 dihydrolipoamide dehydrogenase [Allopseudospirillum japonicum]